MYILSLRGSGKNLFRWNPRYCESP